ncbi:methylase, partial [Listeria monocytogenes]
MTLTTETINKLIGIKESYQASDALMKILFDREKREEIFKQFL